MLACSLKQRAVRKMLIRIELRCSFSFASLSIMALILLCRLFSLVTLNSLHNKFPLALAASKVSVDLKRALMWSIFLALWFSRAATGVIFFMLCIVQRAMA